MSERFSRTELLIGKENVERLGRARVAVFGVGGVGGCAVEALVRSGVGTLDLIDADVVSLSNINRQIIATDRTVGRAKVEVAKERALEINPEIKVNIYKIFYLPEAAAQTVRNIHHKKVFQPFFPHIPPSGLFPLMRPDVRLHQIFFPAASGYPCGNSLIVPDD